jgi:hypothetical protein
LIETLPKSVRYVKNGQGGKWWSTAKAAGQIHLGWREVPGHLLEARDFTAIEPLVVTASGHQGALTRDFGALRTLLDLPSQHLWITIEGGCVWWCTVSDQVTANPHGASETRGHFWLTCERPWSDHALDGRYLALGDLPGAVGVVAGYRATVCEPKGAQQILRIIRGEKDPKVAAADEARQSYARAVGRLVADLRPQDFEVLVDLILARTGWARMQKVGGPIEGIDIEVENDAAREIAFVQVKSSGDQALFDDYVARFQARRSRYSRMIFAVHTLARPIFPPIGEPIQIWSVDRIAELVVKHGLGEWVAKRF